MWVAGAVRALAEGRRVMTAPGIWHRDGRKFAEEVESTWAAITAQADDMRRVYRYADDAVISVDLPYNPSLDNVFEAVKARAEGTAIDVRLVDPVGIVRAMVMRSDAERDPRFRSWLLDHDWIAAGWDAGRAGCKHPSATLREARELGWAAEGGDADRFRQGFGLFRAGKGRPTIRG